MSLRTSLAICIKIKKLTASKTALVRWFRSNLELTQGSECIKLHFDF